MMSSTLRGAVTREAEQETLQCMSNELHELIAVFAETHTQTAELRRVLERTCHRAEAACAHRLIATTDSD